MKHLIILSLLMMITTGCGKVQIIDNVLPEATCSKEITNFVKKNGSPTVVETNDSVETYTYTTYKVSFNKGGAWCDVRVEQTGNDFWNMF